MLLNLFYKVKVKVKNNIKVKIIFISKMSEDSEDNYCSSCHTYLDGYFAAQCFDCEAYMCANEHCSHEIAEDLILCVYCLRNRAEPQDTSKPLSVIRVNDAIMVSKSGASFFLSLDEAKQLVNELQNLTK